MKTNDDEVHRGSGNVFADLEVAHADDMLLKSKIVIELRRLMEGRGLTQTDAVKLVGVGQADLSKLLAGRLRGTSVERLMRMLIAFDQDIEIVSRPRLKDGEAGISFTAIQP